VPVNTAQFASRAYPVTIYSILKVEFEWQLFAIKSFVFKMVIPDGFEPSAY
jgi:hypothetical protein